MCNFPPASLDLGSGGRIPQQRISFRTLQVIYTVVGQYYIGLCIASGAVNRVYGREGRGLMRLI